MSRILQILALSTLLLASGAARPADDEKEFQGKKLSEWLTMLNKDDQPLRRRAALIALEFIGPEPRAVLPAIRNALKEDKDDSVRVAAAQTLARMGPKAKERLRDIVEPLADALQSDKAERVREEAAGALGRLAHEQKAAVAVIAKYSVSAVTAAIKDKHEGTRTAAIEAAGRLGGEAREALPNVTEVLKDKKADRLTREAAARALMQIGGVETYPAMVPVLIDALGDPATDANVRKASAIALGHLMKGTGGPAVAALGQALTMDKSVDVRREAAVGLEKIGAESRAALPALQKALKDDDKFVRSNALHAIGSLGKDATAAIPDVTPCLTDQVVEVRLAAIVALGHLGSKDDTAVVNALKSAAQDGQLAVREAAAEALKKIEGNP